MSTSTSVGPTSNANTTLIQNQVYETAFHRKIRIDLEKIGKTLQESFMRDPITSLIRDWYQKYTDAREKLFEQSQNTRSEILQDEQVLHRKYIKILQKILIDDLTRVPLDDHAYLGNDGKVYNSKSLTIYLSHLGPNISYRSPFARQEEEEEFLLEPHTVARHMVKWLQSEEAALVSERIEQDYEALQTRPMIPTRHNQRIRNIEAAFRNQERRSIEEHRQMVATFQEEIDQRFNTLRERHNRFILGVNQRTEELEEERRSLQEEFNRAYAQVEERQTALERQLETHEQELQQIDQFVTEAFKQNEKIEQDIQALEEALKKRNKQSLGDILAVATVCVAVTWALTVAGAPLFVFPAEEGMGAMIGTTLAV